MLDKCTTPVVHVQPNMIHKIDTIRPAPATLPLGTFPKVMLLGRPQERRSCAMIDDLKVTPQNRPLTLEAIRLADMAFQLHWELFTLTDRINDIGSDEERHNVMKTSNDFQDALWALVRDAATAEREAAIAAAGTPAAAAA